MKISWNFTPEMKRSLVRLWSKRMLIILSALLVLELVFHLIIAPNTLISRVVFRGDLALTDEELFRITGLKKNEHFFGLDEGALKVKLESFPAIKTAVVEKVFPDTLRLTLLSRTPLALSLVNLGSKTMAVCFDREGVVFQIQEGIKTWDLPVVSGVEFDTVQMGMRFPAQAQTVLETLHRLQTQEAPLLGLISEIRVVSRSPGILDLELMPQGFPVKVTVGTGVSSRTLREMFVLLDLMKSQGLLGQVRQLDLRTGQPVIPAGERG